MSEPTQKAEVRLVLNGKEQTVRADDRTMLLDILRHDLKVASARFGCGAGSCGACNVLADGHVVTSCTTPLWSVAGKSITTVEGLGSEEAPHPLQLAFIEEQALQCGYCTSGILITSAALLQSNPKPTESEVKQALDRNLCRCGAHNRIVRAVLRASETAS